jgi:hypothetical protein
MSRFTVFVSAIALLMSVTASASVGDEFYVACWNVENLFDLEDDPDVEYDEDFTPDAPKQWTAERLETKALALSSQRIERARPSCASTRGTPRRSARSTRGTGAHRRTRRRRGPVSEAARAAE